MIHQILLTTPAWMLTSAYDSLNDYYGWQAGQLGSIAPASPVYREQTLTGIYTINNIPGTDESYSLYVTFASNPTNQADIIVNVNGTDYTVKYFDPGAGGYWFTWATLSTKVFPQGVTYAVTLRD